MNTKLFLAAIAGAVLSFLLGWLVYGILLMNFLEANTIQYDGLMMEMPNMFLLILANLLIAFFMAFVFQRWAGFTTFMKGLYGGMMIGFFFAAPMDLFMLSMMNLHTPVFIVVDILISTVMNGIIGGVIAMILGYGKKAVPQGYPQFIMEQIIQPMGLTNTTYPYLGTDRQLPAPYAHGFVYTTDTTVDATISNISANVAEGNMITTPDDLSKFLRMLLQGNGVLAPYWINQVMLAPPAGSTPGGWYGCGIGYSLNLGFGHSGAHEGYLSRMVSDPELDFTAVIFTNAWNFDKGMTTITDQLYFLLDEACYRAMVITR